MGSPFIIHKRRKELKTMKFNINDYKGKYAMHCKTEEEAKDFCRYLHSIGRKWCSGETYLNKTNWDSYYKHTVYYFNEDSFGLELIARKGNCTILEWEDFMNNTFTKADLKTGDVILRENGLVEIVNLELGTLISKTGWDDLDRIKNDLTSRDGEAFNIVAVRRPKSKCNCVFTAFETKQGTLVYDRERDSVVEMTLAEVCKLLGKNIKIVK